MAKLAETVELLIPTSPQTLQLKTIHQIADAMISLYSKRAHSVFFCCNRSYYQQDLNLAETLKAMTSETFTPKSGWLALADVWLSAKYETRALIQSCVFSAFHYDMSDDYHKTATYNGFTALVAQIFNNTPAPCPTLR